MRFTRFLAAIRPPSLCAVCHGWGQQRLCAACVARFAAPVPRCRQCAIRLPSPADACGRCLSDPPPFRRSCAAVDYEHPWDGLITRYKFHDGLDLVPALVSRMLEARADAVVPAADELLLPVPLSTERLRERGYNQAWELARRLAASTGVAADPTLLLRVRDTPHQLAFPPGQRAGNVRAAFAVEPRRAAGLRGRRVTLVDDVMTTGATVAEATRALLQAGAAEVGVWVIARTPRPDD